MKPAPEARTTRLVPDEPFPPYSFVPGGRFPHPESDPAGHSFGIPRPAPPPLAPDDWHSNRTYRRGLDLFNAGYFWESHVEFESLWIACGRRGTVAEFLKGLIKLAAAGVKHLEEKPEGVRSHAVKAARHWRLVLHQGWNDASAKPQAAERQDAGQQTFLGFSLPQLIEIAETIARDGWPGPSPVLLPAFPPECIP